jgi:hypothetical protein
MGCISWHANFLFLSPRLVFLFKKIQISFCNLFPNYFQSPPFKALVEFEYQTNFFKSLKKSKFILVWPLLKFGLKLFQSLNFELKSYKWGKHFCSPSFNSVQNSLSGPIIFPLFPPAAGPAALRPKPDHPGTLPSSHNWATPPPVRLRHHAVRRWWPPSHAWIKLKRSVGQSIQIPHQVDVAPPPLPPFHLWNHRVKLHHHRPVISASPLPQLAASAI